MTDECKKYESLFVFRTQEELEDHIQSCPECQQMQKKMDSVSELLKQVRPYYKKKKMDILRVKCACALFLLAFAGTSTCLIRFNTDISDTIKYGTVLSAEDLGFPVDSYGLITVE